MLANAAPMQRRIPPPNGIQAWVSGGLPTNRSGSNVAASAKLRSAAWARRDAHHDHVTFGNDPLPQLDPRLGHAGGGVDDGPGALHLEDGGLQQVGAAGVDLVGEPAEQPRVPAQPLDRPRQGGRGGLVTRREQGKQFVGHVVVGDRRPVVVPRAAASGPERRCARRMPDPCGRRRSDPATIAS